MLERIELLKQMLGEPSGPSKAMVMKAINLSEVSICYGWLSSARGLLQASHQLMPDSVAHRLGIDIVEQHMTKVVAALETAIDDGRKDIAGL